MKSIELKTLLFAIFLIYLSFTNPVIGGKSHKPNKPERSIDNYDSVGSGNFDIIDEPDEQAHSQNNAMNSGSFKLPNNYNKLEVPVLSRNEFFGRLSNITGKRYNTSSNSYDWLFLGEDENSLPHLELTVDVLIRNIRDVDEINEEITVEMDFTTTWTDMLLCVESNCIDAVLEPSKLAKELRSLDPMFLRNIWKPDLFIENVVSISRPDLISRPMKVLFHPKGIVIFQTRVTVKIDCEMEFHFYPADTQYCVFKIRSYSHKTQEVQLKWNADPGSGVFIKDRTENNFDVKVDNIENYTITEWEDLIFEGYNETYQVLEFTISLRRKMSYHLIQTYLPSIFFIIITWLCFLIPASMVEARIGVSMTTLLTLTSMFASVRESTPSVSYCKAIDIWMVSCIFSVFLTLLEFTVLIWLRCKKEQKNSSKENGASAFKEVDEYELDTLVPRQEDIHVFGESTKRSKNFRKKLTKKYLSVKENLADWIEEYAFLMFSCVFVVFNALYWTWLMTISGYFDWKVDPISNGDDE